MKLFYLVFILSAIVALSTAAASVVRRDAEDIDGGDSFEDEVAFNDTDDDDNDNDEHEDLPIASIKSRAIAMDRDLCRELSRYHPHHPRCHLYCLQLKHWMGMCRRDSCHCYS